MILNIHPTINGGLERLRGQQLYAFTDGGA